jgi:hypothetical protein
VQHVDAFGSREEDCWTQAGPLGDCYGWGECQLKMTNGSIGGPRWRCFCSLRRYEIDGSNSYSHDVPYPSCIYNWYQPEAVQEWIQYGDSIQAIVCGICAIYSIVVLKRLFDAGKFKLNLSTLAVSCCGIFHFQTTTFLLHIASTAARSEDDLYCYCRIHAPTVSHSNRNGICIKLFVSCIKGDTTR